MKKLIITALCFFSMFVVTQTTVQAVTCAGSGMEKIESPRELKKCDRVYDDYPPDIFDYALTINKIALFVSVGLFVFGAYKLSTKKEMTKKEEVIASLFVYSPLFSILFFIIIKWMQNLM